MISVNRSRSIYGQHLSNKSIVGLGRPIRGNEYNVRARLDPEGISTWTRTLSPESFHEKDTPYNTISSR